VAALVAERVLSVREDGEPGGRELKRGGRAERRKPPELSVVYVV